MVGMEMSEELFALCQSIGDAEEAVQIGMIEVSEFQAVNDEISAWKKRVRELLGHEAEWEPASKDWRMVYH